MAHRLKRDPDSIQRARDILSAPDLLGRLAYSADDNGIARAAEAHMNTMAGCAAALAVAARPIAVALRRKVPAALHSAFSIEEREPSDYERLAELRA